MRIKANVSISLSEGERVVLDGIRAASKDLPFIIAMLGIAYWLSYGGGAEHMGEWSAVGHIFALVAISEISVALKVMRPYWRFARWIRTNETMTGQLSLFPHTGTELQLPPRSEQSGIKDKEGSESKVLCAEG